MGGPSEEELEDDDDGAMILVSTVVILVELGYSRLLSLTVCLGSGEIEGMD